MVLISQVPTDTLDCCKAIDGFARQTEDLLLTLTQFVSDSLF